MKSETKLVKMILLLSLSTLSACGLYRSSDRDYFNENGRAGAPTKTAALKTLRCECRSASMQKDEDVRIDYPSLPFHPVRLAFAKRADETRVAACEFEYQGAPTSESDLVSSGRALVEIYIAKVLDSRDLYGESDGFSLK